MAEFISKQCQSLIHENCPLIEFSEDRPVVHWFNQNLKSKREQLLTIKLIKDDLGTKNKAKNAWKLINAERNHKNSNNTPNNLSSACFNKYFVSVASRIIQDLPINANFQA